MEREKIKQLLSEPQCFKNIKTGQIMIILGGWNEIAEKGGLNKIIKSDRANWFNLKCIK